MSYDYWLKANAQLQSMGIYPIPLPDALRGYQPVAEFEEQVVSESVPVTNPSARWA